MRCLLDIAPSDLSVSRILPSLRKSCISSTARKFYSHAVATILPCGFDLCGFEAEDDMEMVRTSAALAAAALASESFDDGPPSFCPGIFDPGTDALFA